MSRENVEIVRRVLDDWGRGDFTRQVDLFDPEITFETFMPDADENVVAHGFEQLAAFTRDWLGQWREYRIVGDEVREVAPGKVFVACRQMARGHSSGVEVESPGYCIWSLRDGKVVALSLHYDRAEAFEAVGLRE